MQPQNPNQPEHNTNPNPPPPQPTVYQPHTPLPPLLLGGLGMDRRYVKNTEIPGRQSMTTAAAEPSETDDSRSLIFQVLKGENGQLVWMHNVFNAEGIPFATFAFH